MLYSPGLGASSYTDEVKMDWEMVDESQVVPVEFRVLEKKSAEVEQPTKPKHVSDVEQGIRKEVKVPPTEIPRPPPPFPQRLNKKEDDG